MVSGFAYRSANLICNCFVHICCGKVLLSNWSRVRSAVVVGADLTRWRIVKLKKAEEKKIALRRIGRHHTLSSLNSGKSILGALVACLYSYALPARFKWEFIHN